MYSPRFLSHSLSILVFLLFAMSPTLGFSSAIPFSPSYAFNGTYIQLGSQNANLSYEEWSNLFSKFEELQVKTLVIPYSLFNDQAFYPTSTYLVSGNPPVEIILDLASQKGITVLVGLSYNEQYWNVLNQTTKKITAYFKDAYTRSTNVANQLLPIVSKYASFQGWYIAEEVDDLSWNLSQKKTLLLNYLTSLTSYLKGITPQSDIAISCFSTGNLTPTKLNSLAGSILKSSSINVLFFQSGIGNGNLSLDVLPTYVKAISNAAATYKRQFYFAAESFTLDETNQTVPCDPETLFQQLKIGSENGSNQMIVFNVPDFMDPSTGTAQENLSTAYLNWINGVIPEETSSGDTLSPTDDTIQNTGPFYATWVWNEEEILISDATIQSFVDSCITKNIKKVYFSTNNTLLSTPSMVALLPILLQKLNAKGIQTSALVSSGTWFYPDKRPQLINWIDKVIALNNTFSTDSRFMGIHLDIEPEAQTEWTNATSESRGYWIGLLADTYEEVKQKFANEGIKLAFEGDISPYYTKYNSTAVDRIIDAADLIGIMSYAKTTVDSILTYSDYIIQKSIQTNTKFSVGARTNDFSTYSDMNSFLTSLSTQVSPNSLSNYVSIHHYQSYLDLEQQVIASN